MNKTKSLTVFVKIYVADDLNFADFKLPDIYTLKGKTEIRENITRGIEQFNMEFEERIKINSFSIYKNNEEFLIRRF